MAITFCFFVKTGSDSFTILCTIPRQRDISESKTFHSRKKLTNKKLQYFFYLSRNTDAQAGDKIYWCYNVLERYRCAKITRLLCPFFSWSKQLESAGKFEVGLPRLSVLQRIFSTKSVQISPLYFLYHWAPSLFPPCFLHAPKIGKCLLNTCSTAMIFFSHSGTV